MKKLLTISSLIYLLILGGCSQNTLTSPKEKSNSIGGVSLQIDKNNAPQDVVTVVAYLSRTGYDTLNGSLDLLSDSSADIFIQNIPAGQWHLTVDALNDSNAVVYSGETDVQISDGFTTQVNLTLVPTGQGTGSIYIKVNWGTNQPVFVDNRGNPVFTVLQNPSNPNAVSEVKIIYDNGIYKMWYLCTYNAGTGNVWYAESTDGIHWVNKSDSPVLDVDTTSAWDDHAIGGGSVIKDGNIYKMHFNGLRENYGQSSTGLAISTDGIKWQKFSNPVLPDDSLNQYHIGTETVLKVGGTYYLYYGASPVNNYDAFTINLATSADGITWTKYQGNPILTASLSWEGIGITYPSVIYDGNQFVMIYENSARDKEGIAYSSDGIHWTKNQNPVFTKYQTKWAQIDYPFLIKVGNEYRIYYSCGTGTDQLSISFARSFNIK